MIPTIETAGVTFDREQWLAAPECRRCFVSMSLNEGCEWPDDDRALLCSSCAVRTLEGFLTRLPMNHPSPDHVHREALHLLVDLSKLVSKASSKEEASFQHYRIKEAIKHLRGLIAVDWDASCAGSILSPLDPECGDHMTMADWLAACKDGSFIDYDGHGVLATATLGQSALEVRPSDVTLLKLTMPDWATHVVWFNR